MNDTQGPHIEVKGEELVVTMTGSIFRVVYRKPNLSGGSGHNG
jgi:hypothetical protein